MEFTCTKENLLHGLQIVSGIAMKPSHLPILSNIQVRATESGLELESTNLEMAVRATVRAKVEVPGVFTVPSKTFLDCVHLLLDERVMVKLEGVELHIQAGASSTKIKGIPADEYPVLPNIQEDHSYLVDAKTVRQAFSQVVFAAAKNEMRPELSGVSIRFFSDGATGIVMASTDSYRLAEKSLAVEQGADEMKIIVPVQTVQECVRLLGLSFSQGASGESSVWLWVSAGQIAMRYDMFELTSRLIDGTYPDYGQIIPREFKTTATVRTDQFINKIKAASLFTTSGVNAVAVSVEPEKNSMSISSTSSQTGEHDSSIDVDATGQNTSILLNHRYLLEGLGHLDAEDVEFSMNGPDAPCVLSPKGEKGYLYIVMPIRQ